MKITIELTEAEVKGIKAYLTETEDNHKPSKEDIKREVRGILDGYFQAPHNAMADYINQHS